MRGKHDQLIEGRGNTSKVRRDETPSVEGVFIQRCDGAGGAMFLCLVDEG